MVEKVIESLRRLVSEIEDFRLGVRLAAAIASVTKNRSDINLALEKARGHGSKNLRAEAFAIITKTLAEARHFTEARLVASETVGLDAYWTAEAHIWIARFSGDAGDIEAAKTCVFHINTPHIRNEARTDLENLLHKRPHHTGVHNKHYSDFKALQAILSGIKGLEDSHQIVPKFNSAHLRLKAQEIIDRLFADAMK